MNTRTDDRESPSDAVSATKSDAVAQHDIPPRMVWIMVRNPRDHYILMEECDEDENICRPGVSGDVGRGAIFGRR